MSHIVRAIKKHPPSSIRNAMWFVGWDSTFQRHASMNKILECLPKCDLLRIIKRLEST